MGEWLDGAGVENAYHDCARRWWEWDSIAKRLPARRSTSTPESFSDALNWFGALVSSVSLVCAIEESIARISELVMAVKKFAYDERTPSRDFDVHDSLQSTLTILGHKLRIKQLQVEKRFAAPRRPPFARAGTRSARCGPT